MRPHLLRDRSSAILSVRDFKPVNRTDELFLWLVALKYRISHALILLEPRNLIILARPRLGVALPSLNNENPRCFLILSAPVRLSLGIRELGTLSSLKL